MNTLATKLIAAVLVATAAPAWAENIREVREATTDGRIEFSAVTGDFTIVGHDAGEFILEGRLGDDVEELVIEGDPSNWRIELEPVEGDFEWNSNDQSSELTLRVPRGSDLELNTVSGDLDVRDLSGPALEAETVSGDINVRDLSGPALEAESVSGDIDLAAIESAEIEIQTVSGDVTSDGLAGRDSEYQTVSGDMDIRGARGRIDVQTVSGHVELEATNVSDFESETVSGDLKAHLSPDRGASLNVTSHSGALTLHLQVDDTPRIRAETFSGSIVSDFGEVEESGFGAGESLRVDGSADAVDIEAKTFSGNLTIRRTD